MPYDVAFRHQQALDPSALVTIGASLHAITRAIDDCRNAGIAFDLRCEIREKLMAFMRDECREALPRDRIEWPQGEERPISPPEPTAPG